MTLSWIYHLKSNMSSGSQAGIRTSKFGPRTSVLMIDSIGSEHLGYYTCTARSGISNLAANYTAVLKSVNGSSTPKNPTTFASQRC